MRMLFLRSRVISSTSASISNTWCLWSPFWSLQPSSSSSTSSSSSPPSQRPSQTPDVFDHRSEALNKNHREHLLHLRIGKCQEVPPQEVLLHHVHDHHHCWFHHRKHHHHCHLYHHHLAPNVLDLGSEARNLPNRISNFSSRQVLHDLMNTSHQPPTEFLFSRVLLLTSELCAFVFCFYYEAWVQNWLKMIRLGEKNYATYSPRPIHRSSFPGWLGNPRGIFFVRLIYMLVRVVLLAMRFCMFCICLILHVRTCCCWKI